MFGIKNLRLSAQTGLGFGSVIVLLAVVAIVAYWGLHRTYEGFVEYRRIARQSNLVSGLEEAMLMLRMNVKDYRLTQSDKSLQGYQGYLAEVNKSLVELRQTAKNPVRAALATKIDQSAKDYESAFSQVVNLTEQHGEIVENRLNSDGAEARKALTELIGLAREDQNLEELYATARVQEQLLLGRLYVVKYLNSEARQDFDRAMDEMKTVDQFEDELGAMLKSDKERALFAQFKGAHDRYVSAMADLDKTTEQRKDLSINTLDRLGPEIAQTAEEIRQSYKKDQDALGPKVQSQSETSLALVSWVSLAAIVLGIFLAWLLARIIRRPIGGEPTEMALLTEQIAQGDLSVKFSNTGKETGVYAAMRDMAVQLREMVSQVSAATGQVSSAASQIAQGSVDLSQRTEEQASALEETSSSMEELTGTVKQSAENAGQANQLAVEAREQAEQGGQVVEQVVSAMNAIHESSRKIADIIGVIDEIAFQTNLLALNAAVEAARAGEQGRGFAVVAGEVRKLAQRSAEAAKEIKSLITDSVNKVEDGSKLVDRAGQTLHEIVNSVKKVSGIVAEMAASAREQSSGIEQVNRAIMQMDQVTQQNAALVEETAAASQSMSDQAHELMEVIKFFKLDEAPTIASGRLTRDGKVKALIEWNGSLSVGDAELDRQHQTLIGIINTFHEATVSRKPLDVIGELLDKLTDYALNHFRYEEERMQAARYPQLAEHKAEHADMLRKVKDMQARFKKGKLSQLEFMQLLKNWLTKHINKNDKRYVPYLRANGQSPVMAAAPVNPSPAVRPAPVKKRSASSAVVSDEWEEF